MALIKYFSEPRQIIIKCSPTDYYQMQLLWHSEKREVMWTHDTDPGFWLIASPFRARPKRSSPKAVLESVTRAPERSPSTGPHGTAPKLERKRAITGGQWRLAYTGAYVAVFFSGKLMVTRHWQVSETSGRGLLKQRERMRELGDESFLWKSVLGN